MVVGWVFSPPVGRAHVLDYGHTCTHTGRGEGVARTKTMWVSGLTGNEKNGRLNTALCEMALANMDLRFLFNTNLVGGVYTCYLSGYNVITSEAPSKHQGGISHLFCNCPNWKIDAHQSFGTCVLTFHIVTLWKGWFDVGCYVMLASAADNEHISTELIYCTDGVDLILVVDINADLYHPKGRECGNDIVEILVVGGLKDMAANFWKRRGVWGRQTWSMVGRWCPNQTTYWLPTDRRSWMLLSGTPTITLTLTWS